MNKKTILVGALLGVLAGNSVIAMEQEQEKKAATWPDTLTLGKTLVAATAVAGGAYVAVKHSEKVAGLGKCGYILSKAYGQAGYNYAKNNKKKVALYTAAGAVGVYGAYKLLSRKTTAESKLANQTPDVADVLGAEEVQSDQVTPVWFDQLFAVLKDVYGDDQATIKSFLDKVSPSDAYKGGNPQVLLQDAQLVEKMNKEQKTQLFTVCYIFTTEYIVGKVAELEASLTDEQALVRDMLKEAFESGAVEPIINTFKEFGSTNVGLNDEQAALVKETNEFVTELLLGQQFYVTDCGIELN